MKMRGMKVLTVVGLAVLLAGLSTVTAAEAQQINCAPTGPFQNWVLGNVRSAQRVVIAIDNSGSVQAANRLPTEKLCAIAAVQILSQNSPATQFAILSFNSSVTVVQGLTNNINQLINAINSIQDTSNSTLMDGAIDAACQFTQPVRPNGALILETDGIPTASTRPTDPLTAARQAAANFRANCSTLAVIGFDLDREGASFLHSIASPGAYICVGKCESVPTLTEWGLLVLGLLLAGSLAFMIRRRMQPRAAGA